jgi:cell division protein FtsW
MILFFIFCSIYYVNGEDLKKIYILVAGFIAMFIFFVIFNSYSFSRLSTYLDSNVNESENYHQKQVMISLGSGGVTGLGLGKSRQKFSFLPEINSDSIFALVGEETGFIGTTILSFVFFSIVFQGFKIALNQKEKYNKFLAVGISSWLGIQTLINLFSMTDLIPLTGIPLPIVSYGGSSTIFVMIALGILLNLSKSVYEKKY